MVELSGIVNNFDITTFSNSETKNVDKFHNSRCNRENKVSQNLYKKIK
jgi:hypothetical protein